VPPSRGSTENVPPPNTGRRRKAAPAPAHPADPNVPPVADGPDLAAAEENLGRAEAAVDAAQHREVDDPGEDILSGNDEAEASELEMW
jgi:hypothetical protein